MIIHIRHQNLFSKVYIFFHSWPNILNVAVKTLKCEPIVIGVFFFSWHISGPMAPIVPVSLQKGSESMIVVPPTTHSVMVCLSRM